MNKQDEDRVREIAKEEITKANQKIFNTIVDFQKKLRSLNKKQLKSQSS